MNWIISWQHLPPNIQGSTAGPLGKLSLGNGEAVQVRTIAKSRTEMQLLLQPAVLLEDYQAPVSSVPMVPMCLRLFLLDSLTCCERPSSGRLPRFPDLFPVPQDPVPLHCIPVAVMTSSPPAGLQPVRGVPLRAQRGAVPNCVTDQVCVSIPRVAVTSLPVTPAVLKPGLSRGPGQHYVRAKTCLAHSPRLAGWPSQGHTGGRVPLAPPVVAQCPPASTPQLRFLPSRPRGAVLTDGSPPAPWQVCPGSPSVSPSQVCIFWRSCRPTFTGRAGWRKQAGEWWSGLCLHFWSQLWTWLYLDINFFLCFHLMNCIFCLWQWIWSQLCVNSLILYGIFITR